MKKSQGVTRKNIVNKCRTSPASKNSKRPGSRKQDTVQLDVQKDLQQRIIKHLKKPSALALRRFCETALEQALERPFTKVPKTEPAPRDVRQPHVQWGQARDILSQMLAHHKQKHGR